MPKGVYTRTEQHRLSLSITAKRLGRVPPSKNGVPNSIEQRLKISNSLKGIQHTEESIRKRSAKNKSNYDLKGRKTPESIRIRTSLEYKNWRMSVFKRDRFTCVCCGIKGGWSKELKRRIILNADHIKPFSQYPELRFSLDNGRTLCFECHKKTDTYGSKTRILLT